MQACFSKELLRTARRRLHFHIECRIPLGPKLLSELVEEEAGPNILAGDINNAFVVILGAGVEVIIFLKQVVSKR